MGFISFAQSAIGQFNHFAAKYSSQNPQQGDDKGFLEEAWDTVVDAAKFAVGAEDSPSLPIIAPPLIAAGCGGAATTSEYADSAADAADGEVAAADAEPEVEAAHVDHQEGEAELPPYCDEDNDGYLSKICGGDDCYDKSDKTYPGAPETPCNGVDEDCDGADLTDLDGDGVSGCYFSEPQDCNDKDKSIYPGANEKTCDGADQNCNGDGDEDWDCDDYTILQGDCDDGNSQINPGAKDNICFADLNCDGKIDEKDVDKDGYGACTWSDPFDCDDNNVNVHPEAEEIPCNDRDDNCDGQSLADVDNDGDGAYSNGYCGPADCDDSNPLRAPGLQEFCDGIDNDCDEIIDEGCAPPCIDNDLDGYGENCELGPDCDDTDAQVNPEATEICNGIDDNCNGETDEKLALVSYSGAQETKDIGICQPQIEECIGGVYIITQQQVTPKPETCNNLDDNCSGGTDEGLYKFTYSGPPGTQTIGVCKLKIEACANGNYKVIQDEVLPQDEICDNLLDDNCNGQTDEGCEPECVDADSDGFGKNCPAGPDCDDTNPKINPAAEEKCNEIDDDCDELVDEDFNVGEPCSFGIGECKTEGVWICAPKEMSPPPWAPTICTKGPLPPSDEICDGLDNDCDGKTDEDLILITYSGPPGTENLGNCQPQIQLCIDGSYFTTQEEVTPIDESCNNQDDDCNGAIDEGLTQTSYSGPPETEGTGICQAEIKECIGGIYLTTQDQVLPQEETCNNADDDCDGQIDEDLTLVTYSGPPGTQDVGICKSKIQECINGSYTTTQQQVTPLAESCNNQDDDCDGQKDENLLQESYSGPPGTKNIGICKPEIKVCKNGLFVITQAEELPYAEHYDCLDNNCDGKVDNKISLATADAIFIGEKAGDQAGFTVFCSTDLNNDGHNDILIGAPGHNNYEGKAYVIYGTNNLNGEYSLSSSSVIFKGENASYAGYALSSGDINNDGYYDILIGAPNYNDGRGKIYLYYGSDILFGNFNLSLAGFSCTVEKYSNMIPNKEIAGYSLSSGDINGDSYDDIVIGAPRFSDFNAIGGSGKAYLIFGENLIGNCILNTDADAIFKQSCEGEIGHSVSSRGDVNDDGKDDLLIGDRAADTANGRAYLIYGGTYSGSYDIDNFPFFNTTIPKGFLGESVSLEGDINGDGQDDILVGAADFGGEISSTTYLIAGGNFTGSNYVELVSNAAFYGGDATLYTYTGNAISSGGDINGDGYDDILIGDPESSTAMIFLKYGGPLAGGYNLIADSNISFVPENPNDLLYYTGDFVSSGDINGDGRADLLIGTPQNYDAPPSYPKAGKVYLFYGQACQAQ